MRPYYLFSFLLFLSLFACNNTPPTEEETVDYLTESQADKDQRMEWWRDATFGMFIHWGAYAVPAGTYKGEPIEGIGEWIMEKAQIPIPDYEEYVAAFNPVDFDAREWARIAREAGMKYMVITSKHHDGFCLWDSEVTEYDIIDATEFDRDILAELKEACEAEGIELGFYHSIMDWHHPDAQSIAYPNYNTQDTTNPNFDNYVQNYLKPQVKELVEKYDPALIWFDGEWIPDWTHEYGVDMYNYLRNLKPELIINNRVDKGRQGMAGMNKDDRQYAGDFGTPEQEILEEASDFDWESCMTMNDTWGYKTFDDNWKSAETLIHNLVDIAAKEGNYLLNVGPKANGVIPEPSVERLAEMGSWLDVNGEVIYATERLDQFREGESIYFTQSKDGSSFYVIATEWPGENLTFTQIVPDGGTSITLLGYDEALDWSAEEGMTRISLPASLQDASNRPCEYAWVFKVQGKERM